ncbi:MAG: fused MFS/spermidine synthase [Deltaproteobacteria bacterium]|nr:fused MFS/spermidine synthase [Deltaproteobacteria bacterium]
MMVNLSLAMLLFLFGAIIMGLEILSSNLMAPYFGGSVYVWGSIISSFMIHMSLGYALGGYLAKRNGTIAVLLRFLLAGSLLIILIPSIHNPLCSFMSERIDDMRYASLAAMLILSFPVLILAMICPYIVGIFSVFRLNSGMSAGLVLLVSTFGSFIGTNLTAFYLIDLYPVSTIIRILGVVGSAASLLSIGLNLDRRLKGMTSVGQSWIRTDRVRRL